MTEVITVNRITFYLTIDNVRIMTNNGLEEKSDQFVAYLKNSEPTPINLGEQVKGSDNETIVFYSPEQAKDYIVRELKKTVYPPDFLHPLKYTKENLSELLHKYLLYDIGQVNSDKIEETIEGKMVECFLAANPPHLPGQARIIRKDGEEMLVDIFAMKQIRRV